MLPEQLSNEICSLKPHVDRLVYVCELHLDSKGKRKKSSVYEGVIRSRHRLTYTTVFKMMEGDQSLKGKYQDWIPHMKEMVELYRHLKSLRRERGGLDFDLPEAELIIDATGKTEQIIKAPRNDAHMLIEEFMIAANEAVAETVEKSGTPGIYRVHEPPKKESLQLFRGLLHNLGYHLDLKQKLHPKQLEHILEEVRGTPEEKLINTLLLRSLKQAVYQRENVGHFGLASSSYSHFTSPIRRYPDLILHRLLKNLKKTEQYSEKRIGELQSYLDETAQQSSKTERLAMGAEREVVELKKCQFMLDKVGNEYWGYVEGIADFGIFVELEGWFVEGLLRFSALEKDQYQFIEDEYVARGRRSKEEFRLGDRVRVRVDAVRLDQREIDFSLIERG